MNFEPPTTVVPADAVYRGGQSRSSLILAISFGNALEMFDFTIFSFFAITIGKLFFPSDSPLGSLLMAIATFGIGFVMRPLGGAIVGSYADRAGRKAAMTLTIVLMAAGTALIGLTPTYASIGLLAPILIVVGRILQGFSAGGEIGTSTTLLMESAKSTGRGFMVSWQLTSQGVAAVVGALSGFTLSRALDAPALESWGWRLPFLLGLLIGPVGFLLRRACDETHVPDRRRGSALGELFGDYKRQLFLGTLMVTGGAATTYLAVFYMPTYLIRFLHMPTSTGFASGAVSGIALMLGAPLSGFLTDRLKRRKPIAIVATFGSGALVLPAFWMLNRTTDLSGALVVIALIVFFIAVSSCPCYLLILESFPVHVRATGMSMVYSLGISVFGGFAQFIATWMIKETNNPVSPAWYVMICCASAICAFCFAEETGAGAKATRKYYEKPAL